MKVMYVRHLTETSNIYSNPFVLGSISRMRSSREQAPLSARAKAF